jgi:predicted NBD/HSP70 family sugar kinase/DNA-binding transcriptional ArsR family regulator
MSDRDLLIGTPGGDANARIVVALRQRGNLSRAELTRATGLAKSTVSEAVAALIASGLVVESGKRPRPGGVQAGRPRIGLTLHPRAGACVGIDFGFRHVRAIAADVSHAVLATHELHLGQDYSPEAGLSAAEKLAWSVIEDAGLSPASIIGMGVAVPGPIDPLTGHVIGTSILPTWAGIPIARELGNRLGMEILVDNESNCGALAEYLWGAGQRAASMVYFKLHSGVGGAILLDGRVVHGISGGAGEFGHLCVEPGGQLCRCGNRGCLETVVGIPALLTLLQPRYGSDVTVTRMLELAIGGDAGCRRIIADAAEIAGQGVALVANALDPELVVIGGALAEAGEILLDPLRTSFERSSLMMRHRAESSATTRLVAGSLGKNASALGAVGLVLTELGQLIDG